MTHILIQPHPSTSNHSTITSHLMPSIRLSELYSCIVQWFQWFSTYHRRLTEVRHEAPFSLNLKQIEKR